MADVTYFGETVFRARPIRFGIKQADRLSHIYAIGKTGVGKSTLLEVFARDDAAAGRGFALIDPHGDLAERVYQSIKGRDNVVYLDATNPSQPYGYNPLRRVREDLIPLAASGLMETFRKLWPTAWGVRMEHVLRSAIYALLEQDEATLPDILRLFDDKRFRREITARLRNPVVRAFWKTEYPGYQARYQAEMVAPIRNKLGALLSDPTLHRIITAPPQELRFRRIMDEGGILIVNLAKGRLGEDSSNALGSLLVSTLGLAALSRSDASLRPPFALMIDEFQTFTTSAFASQMAELRKYGCGLLLANQHLAQLDAQVRSAILGNVGTLLCFRVGAEDAPIFAREFHGTFGIDDVMNLTNRRMYVRMMIDGTPSRPFSAQSMEVGPAMSVQPIDDEIWKVA